MADQTRLGVLLDATAGRDAIHIAVAPVVAGHIVLPGEHVGWMDDERVKVGRVLDTLGVVDPFLQGPVKPGERFYLFLYPQTITGLRHVWTHPAFTGTEDVPAHDAKDKRSISERWLRHFADEIGLSYTRTMEAIKGYAEFGDHHIFNYDTPDAVWRDKDEMWRHYEVVAGVSVADRVKESAPFSCAC